MFTKTTLRHLLTLAVKEPDLATGYDFPMCEMNPVSYLERAIAGLAQFDRRCPPNIRLVGHFGAANICSY